MPLFENNGIVTLNIHLTDEGRDWYCGYREHDAKSLLVPFGQPNGTLILTFSMSGCALEVRREKEGNRIYHDYNGVNMPQSLDGTKALRVTASQYMDSYDRPFIRAARKALRTGQYCGFSFGHLICIKQGSYWKVYNNAISHIYELNPYSAQIINHEYYQAKDHIQCELGYFSD